MSITRGVQTLGSSSSPPLKIMRGGYDELMMIFIVMSGCGEDKTVSGRDRNHLLESLFFICPFIPCEDPADDYDQEESLVHDAYDRKTET